MEKLEKGAFLAVLTICMGMAWPGSVMAQTVITDCTGLQDMRSNLAGAYSLDNDIDCTMTGGWNGGKGFEPIGRDTNPSNGVFDGTPFSGSLEGNGYTISGLSINRPTETFIGLFGKISEDGQASNFYLQNVAIISRGITGAVAGRNDGAISGVNAVIAGNISAQGNLGGITGRNYGSLIDVHVTGQVTITTENGQGTGGIAGYNYAYIADSSFNGDVLGAWRVGGLVGSNWGGYY